MTPAGQPPHSRKNDVDLAIVPFDCFVQTVKVAQVGNVALGACYIPDDFSYRCFQRVIAPARNEHMIHTFLNKALFSWIGDPEMGEEKKHDECYC